MFVFATLFSRSVETTPFLTMFTTWNRHSARNSGRFVPPTYVFLRFFIAGKVRTVDRRFGDLPVFIQRRLRERISAFSHRSNALVSVACLERTSRQVNFVSIGGVECVELGRGCDADPNWKCERPRLRVRKEVVWDVDWWVACLDWRSIEFVERTRRCCKWWSIRADWCDRKGEWSGRRRDCGSWWGVDAWLRWE